MILLAGTAIRFKGKNSELNASQFADALRGYSTCKGSKVVITKTTQFKIKPCLTFDRAASNVIDLNLHRSNGE